MNLITQYSDIILKKIMMKIQKDKKSKERRDLNTPYDLIGLNIWLPESEKRTPNKNMVEYVAVTIKDYDQPLNSGAEVDEETSGEE